MKKQILMINPCKSRRTKIFTVSILAVLNLALLTWMVATSSTVSWQGNKLVINYNPPPPPPHLSVGQAIGNAPTINGNHSHLSTRHGVSSMTDGDSKGGHSKFIRCPNVLLGMARGRWVTRPLTGSEQRTIDLYLQKERGAYRIPPTYQRKDKRCGDVTYERSPLYHHMWFRAICNPKGNEPCCFQNRCTSRTMEECRCPNCLDERPEVHAEYARWQPEDANCRVKEYTKSEACRTLRGANVTFVGDSFIRHLFAATAITLTGNRVDGALRRNLKPHQRAPCLGMHQITGLTCRALLDEDRRLCNDTVRIRYVQVFPSRELPKSIPSIASLKQDRKSLIVMGLGIHDDFNVHSVTTNFLVPFLNAYQWINVRPAGEIQEIVRSILNRGAPIVPNRPALYKLQDVDNMLKGLGFNKTSITALKQKYRYIPSPFGGGGVQQFQDDHPTFLTYPTQESKGTLSPKLLWVGTHSPGVLKSPHFNSQTHAGVSHFNQKVFQFLEKWRVPYLDTFNFTKGTVSFDGTHYGWGINMLKVAMLLTHFETLGA